MKKIEFRPFVGLDEREFNVADSLWDNYANLKRYLNRFLILILVAVFLFIGAFLGSRWCQVGFGTLLVFSGVIFAYVHALAQQLEIKRSVPMRGQVGEELEIVYEVTNSSQLTVLGFYIVDHFGGTQTGVIDYEDPRPLGPRLRRRIHSKVKLDNGMGKFIFGSLWLVVMDPLGLFSFVISVEKSDAVDVFPKVKEINDIALTGTKNSDTFGIYDQLNPGSSISFMGVRPYNLGDPIKYIAWKLSAKAQELLVKVFDNSVSDDVTLFLDFRAKGHMGMGEESTWHQMKETALSLTRQCLDHENRVQIVSQNLYIPWGRGEKFWSDATLALALHTPEFLKQEEQLAPRALEDYCDLLPTGSSSFILTSFVLELPEDIYELVGKLRARSIDVYVCLIDVLKFLRGPAIHMMWQEIKEKVNRSQSLQTTKLRLTSLGASYLEVK